MLYGDIIDVRRRDAVTAGDTHLVTLCDLVLANGVDGDPLAADDARTQALLELGRRFPDSHTTNAAMLARTRHIDDVLGTPEWAAP